MVGLLRQRVPVAVGSGVRVLLPRVRPFEHRTVGEPRVESVQSVSEAQERPERELHSVRSTTGDVHSGDHLGNINTPHGLRPPKSVRWMSPGTFVKVERNGVFYVRYDRVKPEPRTFCYCYPMITFGFICRACVQNSITARPKIADKNSPDLFPNFVRFVYFLTFLFSFGIKSQPTILVFITNELR